MRGSARGRKRCSASAKALEKDSEQGAGGGGRSQGGDGMRHGQFPDALMGPDGLGGGDAVMKGLRRRGGRGRR